MLDLTMKQMQNGTKPIPSCLVLAMSELAQNDRLKRQRASRTEVIRQRKADKRLRQKKERERGIPTIKAPYELPVKLGTMKGLRGEEPQLQDNDHDKFMEIL